MDKQLIIPFLSDNLLNKFLDYFDNKRIKELNYLEYIDMPDKVLNCSQDDLAFQNLLIQFQKDGGGIQSGGARDNPKFKQTLLSNWAVVKLLFLEPFEKPQSFNVTTWLSAMSNYSHFGRGFLTIYLNRLMPDKYSVLNGKSESAFRRLFHETPSSNLLTAYNEMQYVTDRLIEKYHKTFPNKSVLDSFFHFIIAVDDGQKCFDSILCEVEDLDQKAEYEMNSPNLSAIEHSKEIFSKQYQRSQILRNECIKRFNSEYKCIVCERNFEEFYGEIGKGFIEVHHLNPLARKRNDETTSVDELVPVCSNCHRMLHRKDKEGFYLLPKQLKRLIKKTQS